jgi:factor associated with neutral sphingomyelinase activation
MHLSHYSTPGIVYYYMIRKYPSLLISIANEQYQGPVDRIFHDINITWQNCQNVLADNKELIPEFYLGDGSFLNNSMNADLGTNHMQDKVNHVGLPDWANSNAQFVMKMRQALESNHVSQHLHKWVDLVFGMD